MNQVVDTYLSGCLTPQEALFFVLFGSDMLEIPSNYNRQEFLR
jgi:hypothetical protein